MSHRVQSRGRVKDPTAVWQRLESFDVSWHPLVENCAVSSRGDGAVIREFVGTDGIRLTEQRTYISDTDKVLRYKAVSGMDGALGYDASVRVDGSDVVWEAEITGPRAAQIAEGTKHVFVTGLDALAQGVPRAKPQEPKPLPVADLYEERVGGLVLLTGENTAETLVLFLHGIGGNASNWQAQLRAFGAGYSVAALNLRGYGGSELGGNQTEVEDYCADIRAVVAAQKAKRVVLVGLSYGSWIATSFAMRHGDILAGLVLAGGCTGMSEASDAERESFRASREVPLSKGQGPADFAPSVVDAIAGPDASTHVKEALFASMAAIPVESYRDALNCFTNPSERFDFSKITCPVLMLTGEHDRLAPPTEIRDVSQRIKSDVRFEVIPGAGHVCNLEAPDAFNARLARFLQQLHL